MRVELRITSGARAGQRELFGKSVIAMGRHPLSDLRFHPELDADVSGRHAELRVVGDTVTLHDLGSTNGTFVNGQRVSGQRALFEGDLIAFGGDGPKVEFHLIDDAPAAGASAEAGEPASPASVAAAVAPRQAAGPRPPGTAEPRAGAAGTPRRDTSARIADAVEAQTSKLRTMVSVLGALVVVGVAIAYWVGNRDAVRAKAEIGALLRRNDSLSTAFESAVNSMRGKVAGLDSALAASKTETDTLRSRIQGELAKGKKAAIGDLSERLDAAEGRQRVLLSAARLDYESIAAKNGPAVVFIASEQANGEVVSGSGFNVSPSGLVITNRHIVEDEQGRPAKRMAVIFDNTRGRWMTARVVKVSASDELAFLRVEGGGPFPVVAGVAKATDLRVGTPVSIIGYPLGTSTAGMGGDISTILPKSTLGVGTVSKVLPDTLQFDAYAAEGSSGSAVFDARGFVVGVLFGGARESNGRIVYAVPSAKLVAQLPAEGSGIIR